MKFYTSVVVLFCINIISGNYTYLPSNEVILFKSTPLDSFSMFELPKPRFKRGVAVDFFKQRLDHFDSTNSELWQQRYFVNDEFFHKTRVVFLELSGEQKAEATWMTTGAWYQYAKMYKALMFQLEHRFYGGSQPLANLKTANLRYLSSRQALEDTASFIKGMDKKYDIKYSKWVVFGRGYGGSLATWVRMKFPHLVRGAVASSAPLLAKVDVDDYFKVVADSLRSQSQRCVDMVDDAFDLLNTIETGMEGKAITSLLCEQYDGPPSEKDMAILSKSLAEAFASVAQYDKIEGPDLAEVCEIMLNTKEPNVLKRLADVYKLKAGHRCLQGKYDAMLQKYKQETAFASVKDSQFLYQCCSELGWHFTSNQTQPIFGTRFPLEVIGTLCEDVFGPPFNISYVAGQIKKTNIYYGGIGINVRNVIFTHGSLDPLHVVGMSDGTNPDMLGVFMKGASHANDAYPSFESEVSQLTDIRSVINKKIQEWLSKETIVKTTVEKATDSGQIRVYVAKFSIITLNLLAIYPLYSFLYQYSPYYIIL